MRMRLPLCTVALATYCSFLLAGEAPNAQPSPVKFVKHRIGTFRSEALGVGDFNNDGKLDIVAGPFLYLAPDFKPLKIRTLKGKVDDKGKGYHHDFMNGPLDVDGDGKLDVVSVDWFSKSCTWFKNSLGKEGDWPEALIDNKAGNYECGDIVDLDGDGKAREVLPHVKSTVWYEPVKGADGQQKMIKHTICKKPMAFGAGLGDVNGDGRIDVVRPNAWFEAPADIRKGTWKEHPIAVGAKGGKATHTSQIAVYDVDGDKLNDIIASDAHKHGIFWYQQIKRGEKISFKQHVIDDSWSQPHSLTLADINNDGTPDLVTGKRFYAHNGKDPGANDPLCVLWYELKREGGVKWIKHTVSYDEGIGSGLSIPVLDFDGDGDLDIVVTGKWGGPAWFENKTK